MLWGFSDWGCWVKEIEIKSAEGCAFRSGSGPASAMHILAETPFPDSRTLAWPRKPGYTHTKKSIGMYASEFVRVRMFRARYTYDIPKLNYTLLSLATSDPS